MGECNRPDCPECIEGMKGLLEQRPGDIDLFRKGANCHPACACREAKVAKLVEAAEDALIAIDNADIYDRLQSAIEGLKP